MQNLHLLALILISFTRMLLVHVKSLICVCVSGLSRGSGPLLNILGWGGTMNMFRGSGQRHGALPGLIRLVAIPTDEPCEENVYANLV